MPLILQQFAWTLIFAWISFSSCHQGNPAEFTIMEFARMIRDAVGKGPSYLTSQVIGKIESTLPNKQQKKFLENYETRLNLFLYSSRCFEISYLRKSQKRTVWLISPETPQSDSNCSSVADVKHAIPQLVLVTLTLRPTTGHFRWCDPLI